MLFGSSQFSFLIYESGPAATSFSVDLVREFIFNEDLV